MAEYSRKKIDWCCYDMLEARTKVFVPNFNM
jgi:hypothetical protein